MGSPAPVADILPYVWGDQQVKFWELSEKQKVAFVRRFIAEWRELFQYFPAFQPAGKLLLKRERWNDSEYAEIFSSIPRPEGASGFNVETICTKLVRLGATRIAMDTRKGVRTKDLLLTRNGQLLVWDVSYHEHRLNEHTAEYQAYSGDLNLTICTDRQLGLILNSRSLHLFDNLNRMADAALAQREILLAAMRQKVEASRAMLSRVDLSDE